MINVIGELIDIEDQASKILKKDNSEEKIFNEIVEMLKKEIELKLNYLVEEEIKKTEKKNLLDQRKRLHEIEFRVDTCIADMKKRFANEKDEWLNFYLEDIKKISEDF